MNTQESTPLWLDIRKEYIDDNFDRLIEYLQNAPKTDSFYQTTLLLLRQRVAALIEEISSRPLYRDEDESLDRTFWVRLLAAYLLVETADRDALAAFFCQTSELMAMVPKFSELLVSNLKERCRHENVSSLGYSWDDVKSFSVETFAYKFSSYSRYLNPLKNPLWIDGKGAACLTAEGISLLPTGGVQGTTIMKNGVPSLETSCGVSLRTIPYKKLKQSLSEDMKAMKDYAEDFIEELTVAEDRKKQRKLKSYEVGEEFLVEVTEVTPQRIMAQTINPAYESLVALISSEKPSVMYYSMSNFHVCLKVGDVIPVKLSNERGTFFSIMDTFIRFVVEDYRETYLDESIPAKLIDANKQKGQMVWLLNNGTPVYTPYDDAYVKGNYAYVTGNRINTGKYYGKIDGMIDYEAELEDYFDEMMIRHDLLRDFPQERPGYPTQGEKEREKLDPVLLNMLCKILFAHQHHVMNTTDRVRLLCVAKVISEIVLDLEASEYISFSLDYLRALVLFAKDERLDEVHLRIPSSCAQEQTALKKQAVVQLLKMWGTPGMEERLSGCIVAFREKLPKLAQLAKLIQTTNNMKDLVAGSVIALLKREVVKLLSIEMMEESDLSSESGTFLGVESGTVEFKESIVYPAGNGMKPDETAQLHNVMKGVCAFLNSEAGGTLYLGVSDQGYVKGIQRDMEYLRMGSIDSYMRVMIQDKAKTFFGLDAITCLRLEPLYDNQVVAIHISPYPYGVLELNGKAYIRINAESREMNETVRAQILAKKVFTTPGKVNNLSDLLRAKQDRRQVILHGYSSSNSGEVRDRRVEGYSIEVRHNQLVALDLEDSNKCKVFSISRIQYVEILESPWEFTSMHKQMKIDAFHMSGMNGVRCSLQLDLMARNLLLEEYPTIKDELKRGRDDSEWFLDTEVFNIAGIARFYIGLANHIKILDAPELVKYVKEYTVQYLS